MTIFKRDYKNGINGGCHATNNNNAGDAPEAEMFKVAIMITFVNWMLYPFEIGSFHICYFQSLYVILLVQPLMV